MFRRYAIANADLTEGDIPPLMNQWDDRLIRLALSFDGYEHTANQPGDVAAARLSGFARPIARAFSEGGSLPGSLSLSDLRACLFWEERRAHHTGIWAIEGNQHGYLRALIEAMRARIRAGEFE